MTVLNGDLELKLDPQLLSFTDETCVEPAENLARIPLHFWPAKEPEYELDNAIDRPAFLTTLRLFRLQYQLLGRFRGECYEIPVLLRPCNLDSLSLRVSVMRPGSDFASPKYSELTGDITATTGDANLDQGLKWEKSGTRVLPMKKFANWRTLNVDFSFGDIQTIYLKDTDGKHVGRLTIENADPLPLKILPLFGMKAAKTAVEFMLSDDDRVTKTDLQKYAEAREQFRKFGLGRIGIDGQFFEGPIQILDEAGGNAPPLKFSSHELDKDIRVRLLKNFGHKQMKAVTSVLAGRVAAVHELGTGEVYARNRICILFFWPRVVNAAEDEIKGISAIGSQLVSLKSSALPEPRIWLHELGHSLGLKHTFTDVAGAAEIASELGGWNNSTSRYQFLQAFKSNSLLEAFGAAIGTTSEFEDRVNAGKTLKYTEQLFRYRKFGTDNVMDYPAPNSFAKKEKQFSRMQWHVLRNAVDLLNQT